MEMAAVSFLTLIISLGFRTGEPAPEDRAVDSMPGHRLAGPRQSQPQMPLTGRSRDLMLRSNIARTFASRRTFLVSATGKGHRSSRKFRRIGPGRTAPARGRPTDAGQHFRHHSPTQNPTMVMAGNDVAAMLPHLSRYRATRPLTEPIHYVTPTEFMDAYDRSPGKSRTTAGGRFH